MCGRTACTLAPDAFPKACTYRDRNGNKRQPCWRDGQSGKYSPSYNLSPQKHSPVLISSEHLSDKSDLDQEDDRVLQTMKWGLIPPWHKGTASDFSLKMNNARSDGLMEKKSFKIPLQKGKRCVVLADGFYEWQTKDKKKQPYYIFFKDHAGDTKEDQLSDEHREPETNKRLLTMAGLFDSWLDKSTGELLYTYSIITVDASDSFKWIHHRMPAILETEQMVKEWLDYRSVPLEKVLSFLSPKDCLDFYPVSSFVSNSRNHGPECRKQIEIKPEKLSTKGTLFTWFKKSPQKRAASQEDNMEEKRAKTE